MTCKFSIDMKWISELEVLLVQPVFENTLSSSHPSPVQTIPCSFCLPTSHRAYGLAASPALHYPPWSHRGPSFRWGQWKNARPSLHPASGYDCEGLLLPGEAAETCCYMVRCVWDASPQTLLLMFAVLPPAWSELTSATKTGLLLRKYQFFIKTLSSYRA